VGDSCPGWLRSPGRSKINEVNDFPAVDPERFLGIIYSVVEPSRFNDRLELNDNAVTSKRDSVMYTPVDKGCNIVNVLRGTGKVPSGPVSIRIPFTVTGRAFSTERWVKYNNIVLSDYRVLSEVKGISLINVLIAVWLG
jgi:hypothetical protein